MERIKHMFEEQQHLELLRCPVCSEKLRILLEENKAILHCDRNHTYPILDGISRLVGNNFQNTKTLASFNFQYGYKEWFFQYDVERVQKIIMHLKLGEENIKGKRILIVGCGNGVELKVLSSFKLETVIGMDMTDSIADAEKNNSANNGILVIQADAKYPPLEPESVDVIYTDGVLPHTAEPLKVLESSLRLLKLGGVMYLRTLLTPENIKTKLSRAPRHFLRRLTSRMNSELLWKICYLLGVLNKIPLFNLFARKIFLYYDASNNKVEVTQLINFRMYGSHTYRHYLSKDEIISTVSALLPDAVISIESHFFKINRPAS